MELDPLTFLRNCACHEPGCTNYQVNGSYCIEHQHGEDASIPDQYIELKLQLDTQYGHAWHGNAALHIPLPGAYARELLQLHAGPDAAALYRLSREGSPLTLIGYLMDQTAPDPIKRYHWRVTSNGFLGPSVKVDRLSFTHEHKWLIHEFIEGVQRHVQGR